MFRIKHAVIAAALISIVAFGAACSDDAKTESSASQSDIEALNARVERIDMMHAVIGLSKLGLHDMAVALEEGTIESSFAPNTRTAIRLLALTEWPDDLAADAETVRGHAVDLLKALQDEDVDAAAGAAAALHDSEHDFSNDAWAILAAGLPPDAGGVEAPDEGSETPEAGETEEGGHDAGGETPEAAETEEAAHDESESPDADGSPAADETPQ